MSVFCVFIYYVCKACRGAKLDEGVNVADDRKDKKLQIRRIPVEADFLYMFSSAPGPC